jgi:hypothetical protein
MSKNDQFYTGEGTMRLLKEFRAVAGCRSIQQAVDAVFLIAATMTADRMAKLRYRAANERAPA